MLFPINSLTNLLFLFLLSALCTEKNAPFPHAITLAPSSILASRITRSGEIEVSRFPAGDKYTAYFDDALIHHGKRPEQPGTHDEDVAITIVRDAVKGVSRDLSATLGYEPAFAALFLPSVFNGSSTFAASRALFPNGRLGKDGPKKLGYVASAASFAYRLDRCENLSRTPAECENMDTLINVVLVVEYEKHYLHLHLVEVDSEWEEFPSVRDKLAKEFGEQSGNGLREEIGMEEYTAKLSDFFNGFIEDALSMPYRREHIKAIVLAGEASSPAFTEIQEIAYNAVDNGKVRILDDIDPALVVAHGAAMYARDTVLRKDLWGYNDDEEVERVHDEL